MTHSNSSASGTGGSVSSGEVWSAHSEDWEISSAETDPEETLGERGDYSPIGHYTRGRLAKEEDPEEDAMDEDPEEDAMDEDPEEDAMDEDPEEDAMEEDPEEEDPIEEDPEEEEEPEEEPMEWGFGVAQQPLLAEILEGIPLGWELDLEDWAWEDEPIVEDPAEDEEREEISLDGSGPQPIEDSDTESTSSSSSTSS